MLLRQDPRLRRINRRCRVGLARRCARSLNSSDVPPRRRCSYSPGAREYRIGGPGARRFEDRSDVTASGLLQIRRRSFGTRIARPGSPHNARPTRAYALMRDRAVPRAPSAAFVTGCGYRLSSSIVRRDGFASSPDAGPRRSSRTLVTATIQVSLRRPRGSSSGIERGDVQARPSWCLSWSRPPAIRICTTSREPRSSRHRSDLVFGGRVASDELINQRSRTFEGSS